MQSAISQTEKHGTTYMCNQKKKKKKKKTIAGSEGNRGMLVKRYKLLVAR